jgi:hypothetical protein
MLFVSSLIVRHTAWNHEMRKSRQRRGAIVSFVLVLGASPIVFAQPDHEAARSSEIASVYPQNRIQIHLFGGDISNHAPLASWYHEIGITDVWLYSLKGVFPQDQRPLAQRSLSELTLDGVLAGYSANQIRYWWFERPVPDYFYLSYREQYSSGGDSDNIWSSSRSADSAWSMVCRQVGALYGSVRDAGFVGIVYDNEGYYSYQGSGRPWIWGGHDSELGADGNYYKRGLEVGSAICAVWPRAKAIMVYSFGYPGEYWWYKGFQDAGVDIYLGIEHSYGAGPAKPGDQWYQHWWRSGELTGVVKEKRALFDFILDDRHVASGLFPIDFGQALPNYDLTYFREQLHQASSLSGSGPIAVWIWPQGPFTPDSWKAVKYPAGVYREDYWRLMREYSSAYLARDADGTE